MSCEVYNSHMGRAVPHTYKLILETCYNLLSYLKIVGEHEDIDINGQSKNGSTTTHRLKNGIYIHGDCIFILLILQVLDGLRKRSKNHL